MTGIIILYGVYFCLHPGDEDDQEGNHFNDEMNGGRLRNYS